MGDITPLPRAPELTAPAPIGAAHDVSRFDCGKAPLTDWLRTHAAKSEGLSARSYVVCAGQFVAGYYSIATGSVAHSATSAKLRQNMPDPIPVIVLARLAVDKEYQGRGIGSGLLKDALARILEASRIVGTRAVIVHPIDEEAENFYRQYGFKPLPGEIRTLFLPVQTVASGL